MILSLRARLAALAAILWGASALCGAAADPLAGLRPGHPRLLMTDEALAAAVAAAQSDPARAALHQRIISSADQMMKDRPIVLAPPGVDMLDEARQAVRHIVTCSFAYRLTHEARYAARAKQDMMKAVGFAHWNPDHFLDVGELGFALSIGYDWLQPELSAQERAQIRQALKDKVLSFAAAAYTPGGSKDSRLWWATTRSNWNQVCNTGLISAALVLADEDPELARTTLDGARRSLAVGFESYAPDGAFPEGPGYWAYGTTYGVIAVAEMESAVGTDFGTSRAPGFDHTADFRLAVQSPAGHVFNYSDSAETVQDSPAYAWLADRFPNQAALDHSRKLLAHSVAATQIDNRFFALHAVWYPEPLKSAGKPRVPPLDWHFRGPADVAFFRESWKDPAGLFVGFKAGDNISRHAHLDLGSFILDADGKRWAVDLGVDNYELPGYFEYDRQRWTYFRVNNHSHNTVTPGAALQRREANAPITAFASHPGFSFAVANLTSAYPDEARSLRRGLAVFEHKRVLIEDEFVPSHDGIPLHWGMATAAKVELSADGHLATLTIDQRTLKAEVLAPSGAHFQLSAAKPPTAAEEQNKGITLLQLDLAPSGEGQLARSAVLLSPVGPRWPMAAAPAVIPLDQWK